MTQSFAHLMHTGQDQFTQTDPAAGYATTYTLDQITEFIKFDRALRKGNKTSSDPSPAGYFDFARIYNLEPLVQTKFSVFDENGSIIISGPQKGLQATIPGGTTVDATARVMATPIPKHKNKKPYSRAATPIPHRMPPPATIPPITPQTLPMGFLPSTLTPSQMLING